jgi:hypothetical protein
MWLRMLCRRLMEKAGGDGGSGGGSGSGAGDGGTGDGGKPGAGSAGGPGKTLLSGGGTGAAGAGGTADKGGKAGAAGGTGDGSDQAWAWADGTPGTGARPDWLKGDKYKTVEAQARAAVELEAKLGPAAELIGAPAEGKYVIPKLGAELGGDFDPEDPVLKAVMAEAAAMNLSQKGLDRVLTAYAKAVADDVKTQNATLADSLAKLGSNVGPRIDAVNQYLVKALGQEGAAALDSVLGNNVEAFKAIEKLVSMQANGASLAGGDGGGGGGLTRADIAAEQFKVYPAGHAMAGKSMYEHDAEHRAKVDGMWAKAFPGQDVQQVQ